MNKVLMLAIMVSIASCTSDTAYDVLITNGTVYDGSTNPATRTNIGIQSGVIVDIDAAPDAAAKTTIDATGMLVIPGFIDPHTHAPTDATTTSNVAHLNFLTQGITTVVVGNDGGGLENRDATISALAVSGSGANIAFFSGHGAIRESVMGLADRPPTNDELQVMREHVADDMTAGALGLSTGLYYAPGSFSSTDEVIELATVAASLGGVYETHLRDESSYTVGLIAAIDEAIRIGLDAQIPVHVSHIKALGKDTWGLSKVVVQKIDAAREAGIDVTANQYPWRASNVRLASALVPRWVMAGNQDDMYKRLQDPTLTDRIHSEMDLNLARRGGPEAMLITTSSSDFRGLTLLESARRLETTPIDAAIELVLSEDPSIASFVMNPDDIDEFRVQPWLMTGSDGGPGHPRYFASYPKAWRDFVVDRPLLTTERFIHSSSGQVSDTFRLCDRGYIREGYRADIAIIDPEGFRPEADFENPDRLSSGVEYLLVNGRLAIDGARPRKSKHGRVLKSTAHACEQQQ